MCFFPLSPPLFLFGSWYLSFALQDLSVSVVSRSLPYPFFFHGILFDFFLGSWFAPLFNFELGGVQK